MSKKNKRAREAARIAASYPVTGGRREDGLTIRPSGLSWLAARTNVLPVAAVVDPTRIAIAAQASRMVGVTAHGNIPFDVPWQSEIVPGLWQGGVERGLTLPAHFAHKLSLYPWESYIVRSELDTDMTVKLYDSVDIEHFNGDVIYDLARWVNNRRASGGGDVLVHCQAGLNRSGVIVALALMLNGDVSSAQEAIDLIRARRSDACLCNSLFVTWLLAQDAALGLTLDLGFVAEVEEATA